MFPDYALGFLTIFGGLDNALHDSLFDQNIYIDIGTNLLSGLGFVTSTDFWIAVPFQTTGIVSPIYPLFLACIWSLCGYSLVFVRLIQVALSITVVFITYDLACRLFSNRVGILAGIMTAICPVLVMYVRPIMTETLFIPIIYLLIYISYFLATAPKWWHFLLFGIFGSLACILRSEAFLLIPMLLFYLLIVKIIAKDHFKWYMYGIIAAATLLVLLPYSLFNYKTQGSYLPIRNNKWAIWDFTWMAEMRDTPEWSNIALPERRLVPDWDSKTEAERDLYLYNIAIDFIKENPRTFLIQRVKNFQWAYPLLPLEMIDPPLGNRGQAIIPDGAQFGPTSLDDIVHYITPAEIIRVTYFRWVFLLTIPGCYLILARRQWKQSILVFTFLWNVIYVTLIFGKERYRIPVEPILIILSSYSSIEIFSMAKEKIYLKNGKMHLILK
ncbi:MAG: glycosyltransferase family 39 protein [Chloroflexi bacterium]|nr:glycosyltransferase family 39 protein [Chloroflexota bacterium]